MSMFDSLPQANSKSLENRPFQKEISSSFIFQAWILRCELLVSGRVYLKDCWFTHQPFFFANRKKPKPVYWRITVEFQGGVFGYLSPPPPWPTRPPCRTSTASEEWRCNAFDGLMDLHQFLGGTSPRGPDLDLLDGCLSKSGKKSHQPGILTKFLENNGINYLYNWSTKNGYYLMTHAQPAAQKDGVKAATHRKSCRISSLNSWNGSFWWVFFVRKFHSSHLKHWGPRKTILSFFGKVTFQYFSGANC